MRGRACFVSMCRDVKTRIEKAVVKALGEAFGDVGKGAKPMVTNATRAEFGDYQCNAAMGLAKKLKQKPRDVAGKMLDALDLSSFCETPSIAGPGFLNIKLKTSFIEDRLLQMAKGKKEIKRSSRLNPFIGFDKQYKLIRCFFFFHFSTTGTYRSRQIRRAEEGSETDCYRFLITEHCEGNACGSSALYNDRRITRENARVHWL